MTTNEECAAGNARPPRRAGRRSRGPGDRDGQGGARNDDSLLAAGNAKTFTVHLDGHGRRTQGPAAGGSVVTITGSGFGYVRAVYFGSQPATKIRVISPTLMTVVAPGGSGTVNVRVRTAGGITPVTPAAKYSYAG